MDQFFHLSTKQKIIIHLSYRNVFNAPLRISECQKWLGIDAHNQKEFEAAIQELKEENLVSVKKDLVCVKRNSTIIDQQEQKDQLSQSLINQGNGTLKRLGRMPFIRYIGISGSVAANNPTGIQNGKHEGFVDLDLFVICRSNCIYILFLFERVIKNIRNLFRGHHFYCFNYVTDETFLEVYNKNFYTATEINNLKTVYDDGVFRHFKAHNQWYEGYYKPKSVTPINEIELKSFSWISLLAPINWSCFLIFCIGRALKRMEISPLLEAFGGFDPTKKCNPKRISNPNGGYQEAIRQRFIEVYETEFPNYFSEEIINILFPPKNGFAFNPDANVHDKEHQELFYKYQLETNEKDLI